MTAFNKLDIIPVYEQLAGHLRTEIKNGALKSNSKLPSEPILADKYSVSRNTLRKALNVLKTEGLILQHAAKGTFVADIEKPSKTKEFTIGLIFPFSFSTEPGDFYYSTLLSGIRENLYPNRMMIMGPVENYVKTFNSNKLDGLILLNPRTFDIKKIKGLKKTKIPFVIAGSIFEKENVLHVSADNFGGAYKTTKYLIDLGHKNIGFICGNVQVSDILERFKGFTKALKDNGIKLIDSNIATITEENNFENNAYKYTKILLNNKSITAVFASGYYFSLGAIKAIREKKLDIPKNISIVGFDDFETAGYMNPPLTTVSQPIYEMGSLCSKKLLQLLRNNSNKPNSEILETKLIVRESCRREGGYK